MAQRSGRQADRDDGDMPDSRLPCRTDLTLGSLLVLRGSKHKTYVKQKSKTYEKSGFSF